MSTEIYEDSASMSSASKSASISELERDQEEIIMKAKEVEEFLSNYSPKYHHGNSYKLLNVLFELFKSELSMNVALRQSLINFKSNQKLAETYERDLTELFTVAQRYDPGITTLDDIFMIFGKNFSQNTTEQTKRDFETMSKELSTLIDENKQLSDKTEKLKEILSKTLEETEEQITQQKQAANEAIEKERILKTRLHEMEENYQDLQEKFASMTGKNSIERINESIGDIDTKIDSLKSKLHVLDTRNSKKIEDLHVQVDKLKFDIEELLETRNQIESQLDDTHREIDDLTNPNTLSTDYTKNQFAARKRKESIERQIIEKEEEITKLTKFNQNYMQKLAELRTEYDASLQDIQRDKIHLRELENTISSKNDNIKLLEEERSLLSKDLDSLRDLETTKRHCSKENKRLQSLLIECGNHLEHLRQENESLKSSIEICNKEMASIKVSMEDKLTDEELQKFREVNDAFRILREEIGLPIESTPDDIANAVIRIINNV